MDDNDFVLPQYPLMMDVYIEGRKEQRPIKGRRVVGFHQVNVPELRHGETTLLTASGQTHIVQLGS